MQRKEEIYRNAVLVMSKSTEDSFTGRGIKKQALKARRLKRRNEGLPLVR